MKKYVIYFCAIALMLLMATTANADDWEVHQNNIQLSKDKYHVRFRNYEGKDKSHVQLGWKDGRWKAQYQYWSGNGKVEHRPRFDFRIARVTFHDHKFSVGVRTEFRIFESKEDYIRPWVQLGYKYKNFNVSVNPRFAYGKEGKEAGYWEDILTTVHYDWKLNDRVTIQPGFWYQSEGEKNLGHKKNIYSTIQLKIKF